MPPFAQLFSLILGIVYLVVGIAGFIPISPILTGDLPNVEVPPVGNLFGIFAVNAVHSLTHLLIGIAGIAASRRYGPAKTYLLIIGLAYAGLAVFGLVTEQVGTLDGYLPLNLADDLLHIGTAVLCFLVFFASSTRERKYK